MINTQVPPRIEYSVFHILYKAVTKCTHIKETARDAPAPAQAAETEAVIAVGAVPNAPAAATAQTVPPAAVARAASILTATAADTLTYRCASTTARDTHRVTRCSLSGSLCRPSLKAPAADAEQNGATAPLYIV